MEDKKVFTICSVLLRGAQITVGIAVVFLSILQIEDLIESNPVFAKSAVFHSSGLDVCALSLIAMGILSAVIACFLLFACLSTRLEKQLRIYVRPYRLIVADILFLVCWAFSMPMLVIEYPDRSQNFITYKLLLASCVVSLISWSTSTGLDCCQFGDLLTTEYPDAVDEDATVIPQSTISGLEEGTLRLAPEKFETLKPENALVRKNVAYLW